MKTFHVRGLLGTSRENLFWDSRITCKSRFGHVTKERFSSIVASVQASYQRNIYRSCGVDIQSQVAYELALKGIIRPKTNDEHCIYGIKLIDFNSPNFTLEVYTVTESEDFLATLMHDIVIEMKSVAHCTGISCLRFGPFTIDNSLIRRQWTLKGAIHSINECNKIVINKT